MTLAFLSVACVAPVGDSEETTSSTKLVTITTTNPTSTTTTPATSTSIAATTTITSPFEDLAAGALITPAGVVVAILDRGNTGFVVRTPCDATATIGNGEPVGPVSVVLDPGHGGPVDSGAVGGNGLREADLNLTLALATERRLVERGISVVLTRTADYPVRIGVRSQLADALSAEILISIHHNAPTPGPSTVPGSEIFIQSDSERSRRLGGLIWEHMVAALSGIEDVDWAAAQDSGVLRVLNSGGEDAYGMVRLPETVSVLAELAYLSNPSEAEMLATEEYEATASQALADAIETYLEGDALGAGYVNEPRVFNPQPGISADVCEDPDLG
ncbi:MAG: N-acetylmuramoyl-L-alanine amidase [Actinomycetota bacterium]|nr:N-acetylmuramoyl-L-alanine amidase [Actinomycetota bacterium]